MSAPWGHDRRDDPGPRGWLARRWGAHRRRRVARALARHGTPLSVRRSVPDRPRAEPVESRRGR